MADPGFAKVAELTALLKPYNGTMRRYPVSSRVNAVANDDAACAEPVTLKQAEQVGILAAYRCLRTPAPGPVDSDNCEW